MTGTRSHPAIFAGLMGSAAWATTPTIAFASPVESVMDAISHSMLLQFIVGCSLGAAVAGVVTIVSDRISSSKEAADEDEMPDDGFWQTSSLDLVSAKKRAGEQGTTGDLGRYRTGQITIDVPVVNKKRAGAQHFATTKDTAESKHVIAADAKRARAASNQGGRHFATSQVSTKAAPVASAQTTTRGRHFATAAQKVEPAVRNVANPPRTEHPAEVQRARKQPVATASKPAREAVNTRATSAQQRPVAMRSAQVDERAKMSRRERLLALPEIEPRRSTTHPVAAQQVSRQVSSQKVARVQDTMDVAFPEGMTPAAIAPAVSTPAPSVPVETKHEHLGITGRIRRQMRGVREVLMERLTEDALEGVPIITRADGSAIDVGASWFDQSFVPALASITGAHRIEDTTPRLGQETASRRINVEDASRAEYISHHVAEVNVGVFPEKRTGADLEHEDVWAQSMAAITETIDQDNPVGEFKDMVGGPATIDDPDGMEPPTGLLPLRPAMIRPDVVDTATYVDYLLRDEISNNGSHVLSQMPHAHLRVIEGGTGKIAMRRSADDSGPSKPRGRHFAVEPLVAEAL